MVRTRSFQPPGFSVPSTLGSGASMTSPGAIMNVHRAFHGEHARVWEGSERCAGPIQNDTGYMDVERSGPPMTVSRALREYCNIEFSSFFLAVHLGRGEFAYFAGPSAMSEEDIGQVFRRDKFLRFQARDTEASSPVHGRGDDGAYHNAAQESRRRKRARRSRGLRHAHPLTIETPAVVVPSKRSFEIGDSDAVVSFYESSFKNIQQTACKEIAKAFIRVICPKKQRNHPYTKGWDARPDWWPEFTPEEKARHIEPDHQLKRERIYVLKHILRIVVSPVETRPESVRKLGSVITVAKLETAATEALSSWFSDPTKPRNAKKRPLLKELFRVAKMEESYKKGEIDATTRVFVTAEDIAKDYCLEDDDDDDDNVDDDELFFTTKDERSRTSSITSTDVSSSSRAVLPPVHDGGGGGIGTVSSQFHGESFFNAPQYDPSPMLTSDLSVPGQYHPYPADGLHTNHHQTSAATTLQAQPSAAAAPSLQLHNLLAQANTHHAQPNPHGPRSSLFPTAPSDFAAAGPPSTAVVTATMYPATAAWSQPSPSPQTSPTTATTTATSPVTSPPSLFYYHPPQQQAQQQQQHQHQKADAAPLLPPITHYPPTSGFDAQAHAHQQPQQQQQGQHNHHQQQGHGQQEQPVVFRGGHIHLAMQA